MQLNSEMLTQYCGQLLSTGNFTEALTACDRVLGQRLTPIRRCRTLMLKARVLANASGQWAGQAISCLKEALDLTPAGSEARGRVLVACTAAYAVQGSPLLCRRYRDAFFSERYRVPSLQRFAADVEYNVGLAFHEVDQLITAKMAYKTTLTVCHASSIGYVTNLIPYVYHNLVDVYQELGYHHEALACMNAAYPNLPDHTYGAQTRNRRAIFSLSRGDLQGARGWVNSGLVHDSCDSRTRCALTLTLARIALADRNPYAAKNLAYEALRLAATATSSRLSHRIVLFIHSTLKEEPK